MRKTNRRFFELHRDEDATGVSGTGIVAEGAMFSTGRVALTWLTEKTSVAVYDSIGDVEDIHGHQGRTRVVWVDDAPGSVEDIDEAVVARAAGRQRIDWLSFFRVVVWLVAAVATAIVIVKFVSTIIE